ncbi:MAG: hypothetical protein JO307_31285 [Bryobacterales bacterium]|nr:hypothetical protein [Bryobacterales bacterium]MBV9397237.1 hypothetical protein [Bryobacterales bacterium]
MVRRATLLFWFALVLPGQIPTTLSERTNKAFDSYVQAAEARQTWEPGPRANPARLRVAPWGGTSPVRVENGLIHDWVASTEVPGATVKQALAMFQNYDNYKNVFAPEVVESNGVSSDGNHWRAHLRLQRKNVITVVLDTDYDIEYKPVGVDSWAIVSHSTRISEIEDGKPLPPGTGNGYLWRANSYWLLAPRPGGLYMECRTISLSRDIPGALRWIIQPTVARLPRESLQGTIENARRALEARQ